jgi:mercuric ion binding protein
MDDKRHGSLLMSQNGTSRRLRLQEITKMKKTLILALLVLSPTIFAKEIKVNVQGMICSLCSQGVQKKLSKVPGVIKSAFQLGKKEGDVKILPSVVITTEGDNDLDDKFINKLINEAGYNVASIERK